MRKIVVGCHVLMNEDMMMAVIICVALVKYRRYYCSPLVRAD